MKDSAFVEKRWRSSVRLLKIILFIILLIKGMHIWQDAEEGKAFDWMHIVDAAGVVAWAGMLYCFGRLIFKIVRAKVRRDERGL